jgi:hypothetical protein
MPQCAVCNQVSERLYREDSEDTWHCAFCYVERRREEGAMIESIDPDGTRIGGEE